MNKDDKDILQKGDKVLIQVIIHKGKFGERIASECASFCFEINGKLCVYCNGSMLYIHEMHGSTLTKLDKNKHKDILEKYTINNQKRYRMYYEQDVVEFIPWGFCAYKGKHFELTEEQNRRVQKYVKPWSVINKNCAA